MQEIRRAHKEHCIFSLLGAKPNNQMDVSNYNDRSRQFINLMLSSIFFSNSFILNPK